ncbi:Flap endonuclease GEN-like protein [Trichoderma ghanense]|uniref:Flap endonuclease GEN-like protein n=1 Tax=Trichoderma ghanense TaxID=65468 RepID=A0ABY2GXE0_9HYPO
MGIKGIYRELGPGKRVSLSKLASDSFAQHNRPYRIAIDIAIWQFQNQAARGGTNPAIRTLFYRLVRLLGTPIQPIFVFDGPNKPKFKRNRRSGRGDGFAAAHAKRLIRLFGFVVHDAPGEAEAECAFLQRNGIVDAVLSEDVDTIMFGCTRTLRNWSAEGKAGKPTHVSMYDVEEMNMADLGLDREGMVLVALMSGGDYIPEGVPGCGPKVACEAAKAGFGKSLCRLRVSDAEGLRKWRASLTHELRTNESKFFRTRHKALEIPDDFPNIEALRYYTHPVVSPESTLEAVRQKLAETREIQLEGLREFARETFNWDFRIGAIKFIRVLSEGLFVNRMLQDGIDGDSLVKKVSGRRTHFSTDGTPELRLAYIPEEIVPIDISNEVEEEIAYARSGLALNSDEEYSAPDNVEDAQGGAKVFDITNPEPTWVLEEVARRFAPRSVQAWEEGAKTKRKSSNKASSKSKKADAIPNSTLDNFVRVTKAVTTTKQKVISSDSSDTDNDMMEISKVDKATELRDSERISLPPLPQPTQQLRRPQTPSFMRQPSKHLTPDESPSLDGWTVTSSPDLPRRHDDAGGFEAIVISSSPAGTDASPVSRPVRASPGAALAEAGGSTAVGMPKSIRSILAASTASARVRGEEGRSGAASSSSSTHKAKGRTTSFSETSRGAAKLKQLSMETFTQNLSRTEMDLPGPSTYRPEQGTRKTTSRHQVLSAETLNNTHHEPSATNLQPSPPTSSSHPILNTKRTTPSVPPQQQRRRPDPMPETKKFLVPSASRPGFFDEIEVEAEEYEERIAREARLPRSRGAARSGVMRWSDVSFIDLTDEK